jgi:hypothetical protein
VLADVLAQLQGTVKRRKGLRRVSAKDIPICLLPKDTYNERLCCPKLLGKIQRLVSNKGRTVSVSLRRVAYRICVLCVGGDGGRCTFGGLFLTSSGPSLAGLGLNFPTTPPSLFKSSFDASPRLRCGRLSSPIVQEITSANFLYSASGQLLYQTQNASLQPEDDAG